MKAGCIKPSLLAAAIGSSIFASGLGVATAAMHPYIDGLTYGPSAGKGLNAPIPGESALYIVRFNEPPLALYRGEIQGFAPAPKTLQSNGNRRLDVHSSQAHAYVNYLTILQSSRLNAMDFLLGHAVTVRNQMQHALNAAVVELTPSEALQIAHMKGVAEVHRNVMRQLTTDIGPGFIGAASAWWGTTAGQDTLFASGFDNNGGFKGDGIVIGDIDTGFNHLSPSFAATDNHGYTIRNPLGSGTYLGHCATSGGSPCNSKVIGVYDEVGPYNACPNGLTCGETANPAAEDAQGHGSHTGSTSGGDSRSATYYNYTAPISGVAPHANMVIYYACAPDGCPSVSTAAGVDQAIADGVINVLTFSIGGGLDPYHDDTSLAFLSAVDSGIFVAAAAGNTETAAAPLPGSTNHQEPWITTVAAGSHTGGPAEFQLTVTGTSTVDALTPAASGTGLAMSVSNIPVINSPTYGTASDGCSAFSAGTFTGSAALLKYGGGPTAGGCATATMASNAHTAGASYILIVANTEEGITSGADETIPVFTMIQSQGDALHSRPTGTHVALNLPANRTPSQPDVLAFFSLLGPAQFDVIKPDVQAPGVAILASVANDGTPTGPDNVDFYDGTSMATPHTAGAGALVKAAHPNWTPMEIKSALMMTAKETGLTEPDMTTPSTFFDRGSGRIQVENAIRAGLVLDELGANLSRANPDNFNPATNPPTIDGNPSMLNLASMQNSSCITLNSTGTTSQSRCTFTRTFRSTQDHTVNWTVSATGSSPMLGVNETATPNSFAIPAGGTISLTITENAGSLASMAGYYTSELILTPNDSTLQALHLPMAIEIPPPAISTQSELVINIPPGGSPFDQALDVFNAGGPTLHVDLPPYANPDSIGSPDYLLVANQPSEGDQGSLSEQQSPLGTLVPYNIYTATAFRVYGDDFLPYGGYSLVSRVVLPGFTTSNPLANLPGSHIRFEIYADAGGAPAGDPEDGGAIWSADTIIGTTPGLDVTNDTISLNLFPSGGGGVASTNISPGTYWLVVYPVLDPTQHPAGMRDNLWVWYGAKQYDVYPSMSIARGSPAVNGSPWSQANTYPPGQAVRIEQLSFCQTPPSWLSVPSSTPGAIGGSMNLGGLLSGSLDVEVDSSQFPNGALSARSFLCLQTNDPNNPVYVVPIQAIQH